MSIIGVPNLKEIEAWEGYFNATIFCNLCEEDKCEENGTIFRNKNLKLLKQFPSILIYEVAS